MVYIKNKGNRSEAELRAKLKFFLDEFFPEVHYSIRQDPEAAMGASINDTKALLEANALRDCQSEELRNRVKARLKQMDAAFSAALLKLIDEKGISDAECYKRANIDRRLFSKIRSIEEYHASKATVLAFSIALKLNLEETEALLEKAGYTLSNRRRLDVIVQFFIMEGFYDINVINEILYEYDQPLLGSSTIE